MKELYLISTLIVFFFELRKKDFFSPASFFVFVSSATSLAFYLGAVKGWFPDITLNWYYVDRDYVSVVNSVLLFYFLLTLMGAGVGGQIRIKNTQVMFRDYSIDYTLLKRFLETRVALIAFMVLFYLILLHLANIDFSRLFIYDTYLEIRQPRFWGISNVFIITIHNLLPTIGFLISPLVPYYFFRRQYSFLVFLFPIYTYCLLYSISLDSRVVPLSFFVTAFTAFLLKHKITFQALFFSLLGVVSYGVIMELRFARTYYGLIPFFDAFISGNFLASGTYLFIFYNVFSGGFVMGEIFQRSNLYYPLNYKLLSFSPFPSLIDGFSSIQEFGHKIFIFGPFSSFAEAYHFGLGYFIFFILFLAIVIFQTTKLWKMKPGVSVFILLVPFYYSVFRMQAYPLRGVFRMLLLALILATYQISRIQTSGRNNNYNNSERANA